MTEHTHTQGPPKHKVHVTAQVTHLRYHGVNEIRSIVIALIILCLPIYTLDLPVTAKHALLH